MARQITVMANDVTKQFEDAPVFPAKLYVYRHNGKYDPQEVVTINNEEHLNSDAIKAIIQVSLRNKHEIRMTDPFDNLIFHAVGGEILWPKITQ